MVGVWEGQRKEGLLAAYSFRPPTLFLLLFFLFYLKVKLLYADAVKLQRVVAEKYLFAHIFIHFADGTLKKKINPKYKQKIMTKMQINDIS